MYVLALFACSSDPTMGTLADNVGAAFAPCQESEIRFLATKHNFQTVFEPCGNNNFATFAWSPAGTHLYFQLGQTGYVMDAVAEDKRTLTVPTPSPIGAGAWLDRARLVLPVLPAEKGGANRIAVFDIDQKSVFYRNVSYPEVSSVHALPDPDKVLLVVRERPEAPRQVVEFALSDGSVSPVMPWLRGFDTFAWVRLTPDALPSDLPRQVAVVGRGESVVLHDARTGEAWKRFEGATAGALHPKGRWLVLEYLEEEIPIFYQRAWDDMTEAQRRRQRKRAEQLASRLPDSYPKTVRPPSFAFVDLTDGAKWAIRSFQGTHFRWYEAQDYWASFMLWGFESKQFKRNVLLGQMAGRLRAMELGRTFMGVEPANDAARKRADAEPSRP